MRCAAAAARVASPPARGRFPDRPRGRDPTSLARARCAGLHNLGNTCFVNSVLQCLTHTPPLALGCLQHREDVLRALPGGMGSATVMGMLADHIRDALTSDKRPFTPSLASQMHEVSSYLTPGQQECAHEFVRFLFDAASRQTTSERRAANGSRPFIEQLFLGQLSSTVRCAACGGVSHSADDFLDLSLEIGADGEDEGEGEGLGRRRGSGDASAGPAEGGSGGQYSLLDALGAFLRVEQLDADQYYCERCDGRVCAEKQLALSCLPPVLLLHLKRFRYRQKVGTHVACPPLLDLAQLGGAERGAGEARGAGGGLGGEANGHAGGGDGAAARAGSPPHPQAGAEPPAASGSSAGGAAGASSRNGSAEGARSPSSSRRSATAAAEAPGGRREGGRGKQLRGSGGAETRGPAEHGAAGAAAHAGSAGGGGEASERGRYVLYGVIVHRGRSQTSGHYIAYVHALDRPAVGGGGGSAQGTGGTGGGEGSEGSGSGGSWWCFDDSHVSRPRAPPPSAPAPPRRALPRACRRLPADPHPSARPPGSNGRSTRWMRRACSASPPTCASTPGSPGGAARRGCSRRPARRTPRPPRGRRTWQRPRLGWARRAGGCGSRPTCWCSCAARATRTRSSSSSPPRRAGVRAG